MKVFIKILSILLATSMFFACSAGQEESVEEVKEEGGVINGQADQSSNQGTEIKISAATSLQLPLEEICDKYTQDQGVDFSLNFAGSGALREQIEAGAQADIFISANLKHMDQLVEAGFIEEDAKFNLLKNDLVLIVPKDSQLKIQSIEDLADDRVEIVALGEPDSVPAGEYAQEVLDYYGIADQVNSKASLGTDVTQVLNWVDTGQADAGFVYRTDALKKDKVDIVQLVPADSHSPILYPAAWLKESEKLDLAQDFLAYLQGDEVMAIFEKYGFSKAD